MYDRPLPTDKHEAFAQACVRLNNNSAAYREVFNVGPSTPSRVVWTDACRLANSLHVGRRIEWLRAQLLERSQLSVASMIQDLHDIATTNPAELTRMVVVNCRHCHGDGFKYQWRDAEEFAAAVERVETENALVRKKEPLPDCAGGFGFDPHRDPNSMCPECLGLGRRDVWVADTTTLSDKALKLYRGVKVKADGSIEILMHDQLQARDQLHKLLGAYKTNSDGQSLTAPVAAAGGAPKAGDAAQTYMALIHGGKRVA